jgi:hypothetical protein
MPNAVPATLLFFWDYDTQWGADRSRIAGGPKTWGALEFENTERLLELHAQYRVPACFAVVGAASLPGARPYHDATQVRRIHDAGHEVASHSYEHDWLPGLNEKQLRDTLMRSKDALEQCIGQRVTSFVPPYNQPCDYPGGWSLSLSERREAGRARTGLVDLCRALHETGYHFCRVMYRPFHLRLAEWWTGRLPHSTVRPERIAGVTCVRLNTACGFSGRTVDAFHHCIEQGGWLVVYGHPHSLTAGNSQDEKWLVPLLRLVREYSRLGRLRLALPSQLVRKG